MESLTIDSKLVLVDRRCPGDGVADGLADLRRIELLAILLTGSALLLSNFIATLRPIRGTMVVTGTGGRHDDAIMSKTITAIVSRRDCGKALAIQQMASLLVDLKRRNS